MKKLFLVFALTLIPLAFLGCSQEHILSADPVDATLADADTGQPLAGVPVVAYWELEGGSFTGHSMPCGTARVEEAVTDKDGKFHFSGWGPVKASCGYMTVLDPQLFAFKSGYMPRIESNEPRAPYPVTHSTSGWNGRTITMVKYPNPDLHKVGGDSYSTWFGEFNGSLEDFVVNMPSECNWKKMPNMLRALSAQQKLFNSAGTQLGSVASELVRDDQSMQKDAPQCGSPKAFVEALEK